MAPRPCCRAPTPSHYRLQRHCSTLGAEELLQGFAAIKSARHRRAVLTLVRAMREVDVRIPTMAPVYSDLMAPTSTI